MNTASRLESTGVPGHLHISEDTYKLLPPHEAAEKWDYRGPIEVKVCTAPTSCGTIVSYCMVIVKRLPRRNHVNASSWTVRLAVVCTQGKGVMHTYLQNPELVGLDRLAIPAAH